jgi:hypothetical protein
LELLSETGIQVDDYSSATHPMEVLRLVRDGYGMALIREGTPLDPALTTRPLASVSWTVDTALVYHRERHPETIPRACAPPEAAVLARNKQAQNDCRHDRRKGTKRNSQTPSAAQRKTIGTNVVTRLTGGLWGLARLSARRRLLGLAILAFPHSRHSWTLLRHFGSNLP